MKIWMIALAIGLLVIASFVVVNALGDDETVAPAVTSKPAGCGCGGGCASNGGCSNPSCGASSGGSCGCGK